jgi:curved DNA-binding protein CbpA
MHRRSILRTIPCDLKQLPIGAREAFVLSQVHGRSTAEDVAEAAGLEIGELYRVARRLVELGALAVDDDRPKTKRPSATMRKARSTASPPGRKSERSLVPPAVVPVARKHPDLRSLGIGPREGFVLSQVDGVTSIEDLREITGLSARDLSDALRALERAGIVELGDGKQRPSKAAMKAVSTPAPRAASTPAPKRTPTPTPKRTPTPAPRRTPTLAPKRTPTPAPAPPPDPSACDLPEADRAHIAETSARLDTHDHYALLDVERDADGKALRRAFHKLAARYHPDRFYGKKLGPFRPAIDRIFIRLTHAYETLSNKATRDAYDATLPPPAPKREPPPPKTPTRKSMPAARSARPPAPQPVSPPASQPVSPPVSPPAASSSESRPDPLLRAYAEKKRRSVQDHVDVFVRAAKEALDRDDVVAAANNYRLAVQCSDDPALRDALESIDAKARARIRDKSLAGARAAEQGARWAEAAAQYAKAHGAHPEAWIAERAANALRLEGGDLRRAAQLAEQAVLAEPQNATYRVTLGEVYLDAGLLARAAGESSRAMAIAPNDPRANALSKKVATASSQRGR